MNSPTIQAFLDLRMTERVAVAQRLNICMAQGVHETGTQYSKRLLQMIEKKGMIRELEVELRIYQ